MADARIAPVEDNLLSFARVFEASGVVTRRPDTDVAAMYSDRPFPLFNAIAAARFAPGTVEQRARDVAGFYVDRGLPFLWWTTPSTHADELRPVLIELGMVEEPIPGMYVELDAAVDARPPDGTEIITEIITAEGRLDDALHVFLDGFAIPDDFADDMRALIEAFLRLGGLYVLAYVDGRAVAGGSARLTGATAGLYNISTLEDARGRGLGYAVTATLMNLARERGATHAVLHASELGRPVYERLGFVEVCQVPQFVWMPPDAPPEAEPETTVL